MGYWRNSDDEFKRFELFFEALHVLAVSSEIIDRAIQCDANAAWGWAMP